MAAVSLAPPIAISQLIARAESPITTPEATNMRPHHRCSPGVRDRICLDELQRPQ